MIERMKETGGVAFGFKVVGKLLDEELKTFEPQLEFFIAQHKKHPIGILVDLTEMHGAEWKARWDDLRFLQKHTSHIARMAVVGAHRWEELWSSLLPEPPFSSQRRATSNPPKCRTPGNGRGPRSTLKMLPSA